MPLYTTSLQFNRSVVILITNYSAQWVTKFKVILDKLSKYNVIDVDNLKEVFCFPTIIVGLKRNEVDLDINGPPYYNSMDFRKFLQSIYSLERDFVDYCERRNPRMFIISRRKTRRILNVEEVAKLAKRVGFEVHVEEIGENLPAVAKSVNYVDVLVGVHGSGLRNMVFLPENSIVIQIVPFGLNEPSGMFFEEPARGMNVTYLNYMVQLNES